MCKQVNDFDFPMTISLDNHFDLECRQYPAGSELIRSAIGERGFIIQYFEKGLLFALFANTNCTFCAI